MASKNVTPAMAQLAYGIVGDHLEQIAAMAIAIEQRLRDACEDADDIDTAPLTTWRMSQVLLEMTTSTAVQSSVRAYLGLDELPQEAFVSALLADTKLLLVRDEKRPGLDSSH